MANDNMTNSITVSNSRMNTTITNDTLEVIKRRRSVRAFEPEQIRDNEMQAILEAGLFAPSAMNQQSWHLTAVRNTSLISRLNEAALEFFKDSGQENLRQMAGQQGFHIFHHAPAAIVVSYDIRALQPQSDCAAAIENMLLAAESLGIGSCWVEGVIYLLNSKNGGKFSGELGIPADYRPLHAIALGYKIPGDVQAAPPRKEDPINFIN